ncbi:Protein T13C2.6 a, partial [Aphelenchoides avenae]
MQFYRQSDFSATHPPLIFTSHGNGIILYNQSADAGRQLVKLNTGASGTANAVTVDYWLKERLVAWADVDAHSLHLCKYDGLFDWKQTAVIAAPSVSGIAIDWVHGLVFRTDEILLSLVVMDVRSLRERTLISTDLEAPRAPAVDPSCGVVFWSDWGAHRIERAGMDGEERMVLAGPEKVRWPFGLTLDLSARRLYWVEANTETSSPRRGIYSSDYWGVELKTITQSNAFTNPFAIALHGERLYWTEVLRHQVLVASKETGRVSV